MDTHVDNHMVFAILSTLFCCLPLGIVAIIHSSKVSSLVAVGEIERARVASEQARQWSIYSAVAAIAVGVIYLLATATAVSSV